MGKTILILNGPNINRLGLREPEVYGHKTLKEIEADCIRYAQNLNLHASCFQTNHEGKMIDFIHQINSDEVCAVIINPAAWTHTSVAIRDALLSVNIPLLYEVHLSNIHTRESFRHFSYISDIATAVICGLGAQGYIAAIDAISKNIKNN
ncbi:MAG: type II 3-dehydroquinate dehydratase [Alphaproteobacteria bacterium]